MDWRGRWRVFYGDRLPCGEGFAGSIGPGERQGQQGQEFVEPVGMSQLGVLDVEAAGFQGAEQGFDFPSPGIGRERRLLRCAGTSD